MNPTTAGDYTFTNAGISLAASTTYLLTVLAPETPTGSTAWYNMTATGENGETSSDGWTIANDGRATENHGGSWMPGNGSLRFSLAATLVPEPHEYAMMVGLSLVAFAVLRRRMPKPQLA